VTKPPRLFQTASLSALYHARGVLSKIAVLGVRRRATGGGFLIIYKVGDYFGPQRGVSPLRRRVTFSAMRKSPKNRRGTAQDGHSVSIFALPPVPHYGGRIPASPSKISGAQNLSDALNSRRATGPWVCKNCRWCGFTSAPGFAEPTCLVQNTDTSSAPFGGTFP